MSQNQIETVSTGADKAKVALAIALVIGGVVAFYTLNGQSIYVQWAVLLVGLLLAAVVFLVSASGRALLDLGKASVNEAKKVVWPDRKEAITMTLYVFGFVAVMGLFLLLTDKTIEWVLYDLILGWGK